jgi:hypothetical protein
MTKEELAAKLNGRQMLAEITKDEQKLAAKHGLVVVYGGSDDLCYLAGALDDEIGCGEFYILDGKLFEEPDCDCKYADAAQKRAEKHGHKIEPIFAPEDVDTSWIYHTEIPHAEFRIYEDEDVYCIGIVFDIKDTMINPGPGCEHKESVPYQVGIRWCPECGAINSGKEWLPIRQYRMVNLEKGS